MNTLSPVSRARRLLLACGACFLFASPSLAQAESVPEPDIPSVRITVHTTAPAPHNPQLPYDFPAETIAEMKAFNDSDVTIELKAVNLIHRGSGDPNDIGAVWIADEYGLPLSEPGTFSSQRTLTLPLDNFFLRARKNTELSIVVSGKKENDSPTAGEHTIGLLAPQGFTLQLLDGTPLDVSVSSEWGKTFRITDVPSVSEEPILYVTADESDTGGAKNKLDYDFQEQEFLAFVLHNRYEKSLFVQNLTISRMGNGERHDFGEVWLEDEHEQLLSQRTNFIDAAGEDRADFTLNLDLASGETVHVRVMASGTHNTYDKNIGHQNAFMIRSNRDLDGETIDRKRIEVRGAFPLSGKTFHWQETDRELGVCTVEIPEHATIIKKRQSLNGSSPYHWVKANGQAHGQGRGPQTYFIEKQGSAIVEGSGHIIYVKDGGRVHTSDVNHVYYEPNAKLFLRGVRRIDGLTECTRIQFFGGPTDTQEETRVLPELSETKAPQFCQSPERTWHYNPVEARCVYRQETFCTQQTPYESYQSCRTANALHYGQKNPALREYEDLVRSRSFEPFTTAPQHFSDTDPESDEGKAALYLKEKNVLGGFPDGEFKGDRPVNRAEMAKFLLLAKGESTPELKNNNRFPDVLEGEWYTKYVLKASNMDIINGYPNGFFLPGKTVNTAEFLKMLSKTFRLPEDLPFTYDDVSSSAWFAPYAGVAEQYDLFPGRSAYDLEPERELTRREVAVALHRYLRHVEHRQTAGPINVLNVTQVKPASQQTTVEAGRDNISALTLRLSTAQENPIHISNLTFRRIGNGDASDFAGAWVESNGVRASNTEELPDGDIITFPVDIEVKQGITKDITLRVNTAANATSGNSHRFTLYLPEWIEASVDKVGLFPFGGVDIDIR